MLINLGLFALELEIDINKAVEMKLKIIYSRGWREEPDRVRCQVSKPRYYQDELPGSEDFEYGGSLKIRWRYPSSPRRSSRRHWMISGAGRGNTVLSAGTRTPRSHIQG